MGGWVEFRRQVPVWVCGRTAKMKTRQGPCIDSHFSKGLGQEQDGGGGELPDSARMNGTRRMGITEDGGQLETLSVV